VGLRRQSSVALYLQIAAALARDIAQQRYKPLDRLPTERQLMKRHGVSRITVRQAVERLVSQGLAVSKQGKGSFVAGPVVQHELQALQGFYDALVGQGQEPKTRLLDFGPRAAPPDAAELLGAKGEREAVYLARSYSMRERPFAHARAWLAPAARGVSWEDAERHPLYAILQNLLGLKVTRAEVGIIARGADPEEAARLGLNSGSPVLVMERVSYGARGEALEKSRFSIRPESYRFKLSVQGPLAITRQIERVAPASRKRRRAAGPGSHSKPQPQEK
jgi:GntR family transcriptional regulator